MKHLVLCGLVLAGCGARTPIDLGGDGGVRPGDDDDDVVGDDDDDVVGDDDDDVIGDDDDDDDDDDVVSTIPCEVVSRVNVPGTESGQLRDLSVATSNGVGVVFYGFTFAAGREGTRFTLVDHDASSLMQDSNFAPGTAGDVEYSPLEDRFFAFYLGPRGALRAGSIDRDGNADPGDMIGLEVTTPNMSLSVEESTIAFGFDSGGASFGVLQRRDGEDPTQFPLLGGGPSTALAGDTAMFASLGEGVGYLETFDVFGNPIDAFEVGSDFDLTVRGIAIAQRAPEALLATYGEGFDGTSNNFVAIDWGFAFHVTAPIPNDAESIAIAYDPSRDRAGIIVSVQGEGDWFYLVDAEGLFEGPLALGDNGASGVDIAAVGDGRRFFVGRSTPMGLEPTWIGCE